MSADPGYYRAPTIHGERVAFLSEDDLWEAPLAGGVARRLTSGEGAVRSARYSPDGRWLAFSASEEGPVEVYVMPASGGAPRRLTFLGERAEVVGWTPDGRVAFTSAANRPFFRDRWVWAVPPEGGEAERLPLGRASSVAWGGPGGAVALCRRSTDPAHWKRYRGGRAGSIWVDPDGSGSFSRLPLEGQLAWPFWIGPRLWFFSDADGHGALWSCALDGSAPRREVAHPEFFVRAPDSDGDQIVFAAGGALFRTRPGAAPEAIAVDYRSPRTWRRRRFKSPERGLQGAALHPDGRSLALTIRGRVFCAGAWEGPVTQLGERDGVRYRLACYLDAERILCVSDAGGEEGLEIHRIDGAEPPRRVERPALGRILELAVSGDQIAFTNHRHEVGRVDLTTETCEILDRSERGRCAGLAWSADGRWLAWSRPESQHGAAIWLYDTRSASTHRVTSGRYRDRSPSFDPAGRFLAFLSDREFRPVYDALQFELGFPRGSRPYVVTLRRDAPSPFQQDPRPMVPEKKKRAEGPVDVRIDLNDIGSRIVPAPVPEGRYGKLACVEGKILFSLWPIRSGRVDWRGDKPPPSDGTLSCWDLEEGQQKTLVEQISSFHLDASRKSLLYQSGWKLRLIRAGQEPPKPERGRKAPPRHSRKVGWIDLKRISVSVSPPAEWRQIFRESWRLMRDHFWTEDMSGVDWSACYARYSPLLDRIGCRSELSDLIWEMQGELGTSHAYEMGGDYRQAPRYSVGKLGAELRYDPAVGAHRIAAIARGEPGQLRHSAPLSQPGVNLSPGDRVVAVNGRRASATEGPSSLLVHCAGKEITLTVERSGGGAPRQVRVRATSDDRGAWYREWTLRNRAHALERSGGRLGYVHVPDMGPDGFAAFHRDYLSEIERDGLVVDVRWNRGGHVSQLLFQKLARRRLAWNVSRWGAPTHYPWSAPGPMICVTNEMAGSDGDIFSHAFKMQGLGELVGARTWGGVIGIWPRFKLVDGSVTSQPEFSYWFEDARWGVENYGAVPDVVVDHPPQDMAADRDPQLDEAIRRLMERLEGEGPRTPDFGPRPRLGGE